MGVTINPGLPGTILAVTICLGVFARVLFHSEKYPGLDNRVYSHTTSNVLFSNESNNYYLGTQYVKGQELKGIKRNKRNGYLLSTCLKLS